MNINTEKDLQEYLKNTSWQNFEELTAHIFEQNKYVTKLRKIIKRKQYDVIAEKDGKIICAECKKWKKPITLKEIIKHKQRTYCYHKKAQPVMITLYDEGILSKIGTLIIPINKLNTYLNSI